jgi:1-aminocyclopropane-1-carboxylate deaminase/D-cysteine desulfhydrase-like pyridoxal-dependent ACC family enzyme
MRVLFLLHQGNMFSGGQGVYTAQVTRQLARQGHDVHLVVGPPWPETDPAVTVHKVPSYSIYRLLETSRFSGNLVLDRLFGATLHFAASEDWSVLEAEVDRIAGAIGPKAYAMPVGGATPVGALAYVHAADELLAQMAAGDVRRMGVDARDDARADVPPKPDWIVIADGSGGTHAGLLAGLPASVRVLGIDVSRPPTPLSVIVPRLAAKTASLAGRPAPAGEVIIADHAGSKYASITAEAQDAVRLAARTEALVLDPVYTGKAMAGLIAAAREGRVSGTVVFWHTGGSVALFADEFAGFVG